jgi:hexosaminidase
MIDIARNFQSKEETLRLLDLMALYKMNILHLHFSDDEGWRLQIPGLPELTEVGARRGHRAVQGQVLPTAKGQAVKGELLPPSFGSGADTTNTNGSGYYTKAGFIEILKYATERHISVIPEIESPGHARAAVRAMDTRYAHFMQAGDKEEAMRYLLRDTLDQSVYRSAQMWSDNVMNPALHSVYRFMGKVMDEIQDMYKEAGAPLATIHVGGDEVPSGAWEKSPACNDLIKSDPSIGTTAGLWYYYLSRVNQLLKDRGLFLSAWEEVALRKGVVNRDFGAQHFQVHVWNNFIGSGGEDLAYKLANAGYKVVLAGVTNFYFDMAYEKAFDEPGYYWGAYIDVDKPFSFIPYDYLKNTKEDNNGRRLDAAAFANKESLTDSGKSNIVGIQGLVWGETVKGQERLEYMLLPRLLGVAERAWAKSPAWATEKEEAVSARLYREAWNVFINVLSKRELPRLDHYAGGFQYRIPAAGARVEAGRVVANVQLPGFTIRYTSDGKEPDGKSKRYTGPITDKGLIRLAVFSPSGRRGRMVALENK